MSIEWDGKGLPPVGCECEYSLNGGRRWDKCKIEYEVGTQGVVISYDVFKGVQYVSFNAYPKTVFRLMCTKEERRREESTEAMNIAWRARAGEEDGGKLKSIYEIIYDAIAAGKIPGIRLTDDAGS